MVDSNSWTEVFKPKHLDYIVGHVEHVQNLKSWIYKRYFPHLLFMGAPGLAKSTIAQAYKNELSELSNDSNSILSFMVINASSF